MVPRISIGSGREDPVDLTRQDWRGPEAGWAPRDIGHWEVDVLDPGPYRIELRFAKTAEPAKVRLELGEAKAEADVPKDAESAVFEGVRLPAGPGDLRASIEDAKGRSGVHQASVARPR